MKVLGSLVCLLGSLAAIAYPPYRPFDLGDTRWGFILEDLVSAFGKSITVYDHIVWQTLAIELVAINAVGLVLVLLARR
jgi:cytochrome c oxidase subunit IV